MEDCGFFLSAVHRDRPDYIFKALIPNKSGKPKKLKTMEWAVLAKQCGMHRFLEVCLDRLVMQKVSLPSTICDTTTLSDSRMLLGSAVHVNGVQLCTYLYPTYMVDESSHTEAR